MIATIITVSIINIAGVILGILITLFFLDEERLEKVTKRFKKKPKGLGAVNKPTYAQLQKRGTILEETEQAMEDTLDKIIPDDEKPEAKRKNK